MSKIRYLKTERGVPRHVNYHFDDQGHEVFTQRAVDETDFAQFAPGEEERKIAQHIRDENNRPGGTRRRHYEGNGLTIDS